MAFCENAEQLNAIELNNAGEFRIVALTPSVAWACQQRGLAYLKLDDYSSSADLARNQAALWSGVLDWVQWVDAFLHDGIPAFKEAAFYPARAYFYFLQRLFAEIYTRSRILDSFLASASPEAIVYWKWPARQAEISLNHKEPICNSLLPAATSRHGFVLIDRSESPECSPLGESQTDTPRGLHGSFYMALRKRVSGRAWEELRLIGKAGAGSWLQSLLREGKTGTGVLFIGSGHNLDPLAVALREKGVKVRWISTTDFAASGASMDQTAERQLLGGLWEAVKHEASFLAPLSDWNVPMNPKIEASLSHWWNNVIPLLWAVHARTSSVLATGSYSAVVAGNAGSGGVEGAVIGASRFKHHIPAVIYQHGGSANLCEWASYECLMNADSFLVYGEQTAGVMRQAAREFVGFDAQVVTVGSARLDKLKQSMKTSPASKRLRQRLPGAGRSRLVLYVPSHYNGYGRALSDLADYPDISYFELQQRVLGIFARYPNVKLIYKDFPVADSYENPIPAYIRDRIPNGSTILTRLTSLMPAVDAIVVDHAITALGEALLTDKPIIVYSNPGGDPRIQTANAMLRKRAIVAETEAGFEEAVERFLASEDFRPLTDPGEEFLKAWCTGANDGNSAGRAADEVIRIAKAVRPGPPVRLSGTYASSLPN